MQSPWLVIWQTSCQRWDIKVYPSYLEKSFVCPSTFPRCIFAKIQLFGLFTFNASFDDCIFVLHKLKYYSRYSSRNTKTVKLRCTHCTAKKLKAPKKTKKRKHVIRIRFIVIYKIQWTQTKRWCKDINCTNLFHFGF